MRPVHVLLADDDEIFTMLVQRAFGKHEDPDRGPVLHCVDDGSRAMAWLRGEAPYDDRDACPRPDLVLLDQRMCRMDGVETLEAIKRDPELSSLPVGILSTSSEEELRSTCYARGASFFLRKSLDYAEMKHKLELLVRFCSEVLEVAGSGR